MRRSSCAAAIAWLVMGSTAQASDAPDWMHALVSVPLPAHAETASAVLLYSERVLTVRTDGRLKTRERKAWRILRPEGASYGKLWVSFDDTRRITDIRGWCIPASGKDFVVKEKEMAETGLPGIADGYLVSDQRAKVMLIPAALPGSVIGYEVEQDKESYSLNDEWDPQEPISVREAHYTLQLPAGWTHTVTWINYSGTPPAAVAAGTGQWQWVVSDLPAVQIEERMPPWQGVATRMVVSVSQTAGQSSGWNSWQGLGEWALKLLGNRREPSAEIRAKAAELTAAESAPLGRIRALARFVQRDIRYVGIELGIGGYQPHPAAEVFAHRYGDCKDKSTLLASMLQVIGVESFPVWINTVRGTVSPEMPANNDFNHEIIAIRLPPGSDAPDLLATVVHPQLGRLLFFDPTNPETPLGRLPGHLQANYGMIVAPGAGELIRLPQLAAETSGLRRTASLALGEDGTLRGDIVESHVGDEADAERVLLRGMPLDVDRIKPIEARLTSSLASFRIVKAAVGNVEASERPFEWHYSLEAGHYARSTAGLLLLRPRVLGSMADLFSIRDDRQNAIEFEGPERDSDVFEIELPAAYTPDELPSAVNADYGFASYSSRTELAGHKLTYRRSLEIRQLSVPASQAGKMRELFSAVAEDERRTIVLQKAGTP